MKRDLWIAGLIWMFATWTAALPAQQPVWKAVAQPAAAADPPPAAALGPPVAESSPSGSQVVPVGYKEHRPAGREGRNADVIAATAPGGMTWPDQEESEISEFAAERMLGAPRAVVPVSGKSATPALASLNGAAPGAGMFHSAPHMVADTSFPPPISTVSPLMPTLPSNGNGGPITSSSILPAPTPEPGPVSSSGPVPGPGPVADGDGSCNGSGSCAAGCCGADGCPCVCGDGDGTCMGMDYVNSGFSSMRSRGPRHFYLMGEYLLWWLSDQHISPLVTTSTNPADAGIIGRPTTSVLFGGNGLGNTGPFSGGRFRAGYWFDSCMTNGFELSYFFLGTRSTNFSASSSASTSVIGRPFFNINTGMEDAEQTSNPLIPAVGSLHINAATHLWGAEANWRHRLCCGCNYRFDALAGFRFLNLSDSINFSENVTTGLLSTAQGFTPAQVAFFSGSSDTAMESFRTSNQFYGGQIGFGGWYYFGRLSLNLRAMVALGDTVQNLNISGATQFKLANGGVLTFPGNLYAQQSNIGNHTNNEFSVVPEAMINVGYQLTQHLRAYVGYNFLYWSNVARAPEQIDRNIDVSQIPPPGLFAPGTTSLPGSHPGVSFHQTGFWAQGLVFGLQFLY